jgi:hypothetical protein
VTVHVPDQSTEFDEAVSPQGPDRAPRSRRPLIAGGLAAVWALLVGVALVTCLVMLAWAVSPNSAGDSAAAWRAAGLAWLGSHLVPLQVSGQPVTLLPIGGLLLGLLLTRRAGAWTGRLLPSPSTAEAVSIVAGASLIYGAGGAGIAWLSAGDSAAAEPGWALLVTGLVAGAGTLWGISREADLAAGLRARMTDATWQTVSAAGAAVLGMVAVGAALLTASLLRHFGEVAGTLAALDAGFVGAAGLTLIGALSLPNMAIWAMSVLVGPGFAVGSTGGLSLFGGEVESLPALPVLAAIPSTVPAWAPVLMVVPVLLGVLAGRVRWGRDLPTLSGALLSGAGVAAVVAVLVAGLGALSSGSFGGGQLAGVGPVLVPVTAAATGLVLLGFLLEAGFQSARLTWDLHRAEQRAAALRQAGDPMAAGQADAAVATGLGAQLDVGPEDDLDPDGGQPSPGGRPGPSVPGPWSTMSGLVTGPRSVVTSGVSRVSGAGASAVRVVSGVGASALAGVGGARAAAVTRAGAAGAAVMGAVRAGAPDRVQAEDTTLDDEVLRSAADETDGLDVGDGLDVADGPDGADQLEAAVDVVERTDAAGEPAIDLREADVSGEPSGSEIDLREVDQPVAGSADGTPAEHSDGRPDDQSVFQQDDRGDDAAGEPDLAHPADPLQGGHAAPATARADDDTAEIPVIGKGSTSSDPPQSP